MVLSRLKKVRTAIRSAPKAAQRFGETLVSEGRKDLARKGSPAQRFADAPLGQYYLPKPLQKAGSFLAPSPRKTVRDINNVVRRPGLGTGAAAAGDVASIATLPLLASSAFRGTRILGRGAMRTTPGRLATLTIRGGEEGKLTRFPLRGSTVSRIRAQVFNKIKAASEASGEGRTQYLQRRIGEVKQEIAQLDAAELRHKGAPTSLRNLSNIRDKATKAVKGGEEGFLRLPKGEGNSGAREVVRRANLKATRTILRHNIGTAKQLLSMETDQTLTGVSKDVAGMISGGKGKNVVRLSGMESGLPAKTVAHLTRKEKAARAAMKAIGMNPGKVVRTGGSMIEIEGRMPLTGALARLNKSDLNYPSMTAKTGGKIRRIKLSDIAGEAIKYTHPGRSPRN